MARFGQFAALLVGGTAVIKYLIVEILVTPAQPFPEARARMSLIHVALNLVLDVVIDVGITAAGCLASLWRHIP